MKFTETKLKGVWLIEPDIFHDTRGFFMEEYNQRKFRERGISEDFVQDNVSRSPQKTLRGLHYQLAPHGQGKLVRVHEGEVFDVAVDLRRGSPTFGMWSGHVLSSQNRSALYVPPGFAHGFCVLSKEAEFSYKCTALYHPASERAIAWNDPAIGIEWPLEPDPALMSAKDRAARLLAEAEINFTYETKPQRV